MKLFIALPLLFIATFAHAQNPSDMKCFIGHSIGREDETFDVAEKFIQPKGDPQAYATAERETADKRFLINITSMIALPARSGTPLIRITISDRATNSTTMANGYVSSLKAPYNHFEYETLFMGEPSVGLSVRCELK